HHYLPQGRLDLRIDLTGGYVHKGRRQLGQQGFEPEPVLYRRGQRATSLSQGVAQVRSDGGKAGRPTPERAPDSIPQVRPRLVLAGGLIPGGYSGVIHGWSVSEALLRSAAHTHR